MSYSMGTSDLCISTDRTHVILPCGCGGYDHSIEFTDTREEKYPDDPLWMSVHIRNDDSLKARIAAAWRALIGKEHRDSILISEGTGKELGNWLLERTAPLASKTPNSSEGTPLGL